MIDSRLLAGLYESSRLQEKTPRSFTAVSTDTRTLVAGSLFVPLIGERFNGHAFLEEAISRGATAALWQEGEPLPEALPDDVQLYFVKDTLVTLQQMAKAYRRKVNPTVIAVTGSNGKTTTKDILYSIFSLHGETFKTQGNLNNHIGVPLTILAMPETCKYLIVEMGMSDFGEIALLSKLAEPNYAIVTNIGESHIEQLGDRAGIAKAKMEIREGLKEDGIVIVDGDEPLLKPYVDERTVKVGFSAHCDETISNLEAKSDSFAFTLSDSFAVKLNMLGKHNVKNASFCIALAKRLSISEETIKNGLHSVTLTSMRLERMIGKNGELIINDAYNASPTSMRAAIDTLKAIPNFKKYIVVLGNMFELGKEEEKLHRSIATSITKPITHLICVGDKAKWILEEWKEKINDPQINIFHSNEKSEVAHFLETIMDEKTVILFKASRGMKLEEIINEINRKGDDE